MVRLRMGFVEKMLTSYPRGTSRARDDRYEVNLPVVPAGTPSARAEAVSWLVRLLQLGCLPLELGAIAPDGVQDDGELARQIDAHAHVNPPGLAR